MRQAGSINLENDAKRFVDHLLTLGIEARAELGDNHWNVWILDESRLAEGRAELALFQQNPQDPKYQAATRQAEVLRKQTVASQRQKAKNVVNMGDRWSATQTRGSRRLTWAMIAACVLVGLITKFGKDQAPIAPYLFITNVTPEASKAYLERLSQHHLSQVADIENLENAQTQFDKSLERWGRYDPTLPEVRRGEVWRLITPIFIHMDIFHLAFNMYWLFLLGGMIEDRYGSLWLAVIIIVSAIGSNLLQDYWAGPTFGGMSGVNYALVGYIWLKSRFEPASGLYLSQQTLMLLLLWLVLCFTGMVGPVANAAHLGGLIIGMIFGYFPQLLKDVRRSV